MVDSEYSPENNKTLKISIGAIMKNPEMSTARLKECVRKLPFVIIHVPD